MSSKTSEYRKRRDNDFSRSSSHKHRHRDRSRSRSPSSSKKKENHAYRSEKSNNGSKTDREDTFNLKKVKSEPADKGYRKYEYPERGDRKKESRSRWDDEREEEEVTRRRDGRDRKREPPQMRIKEERDHNDERRREHRRQAGGENPFQTTNEDNRGQKDPPAPKEAPNFGLSGALTEDTNTFRGIVIKYNEPPEARKPKMRWRLYVFKGDQELPTLYIHRQSAYLLGRERLIADLPIDHPSCSKQHAAIQYRLVEYDKSDGTTGKRVRPYIIDLESANGTFLNNKQIEPKRYYEMKEKDVLKFGFSSREYVVLTDKTTAGDIEDEGEL